MEVNPGIQEHARGWSIQSKQIEPTQNIQQTKTQLHNTSSITRIFAMANKKTIKTAQNVLTKTGSTETQSSKPEGLRGFISR